MRHPWKDQKKHTPYFNVPFFTLINAHLPLAPQSIQCVDAFECWRVFFFGNALRTFMGRDVKPWWPSFPIIFPLSCLKIDKAVNIWTWHGGCIKANKTTGKEIHTDTKFYLRPETSRVGLRILFQRLKFRGSPGPQAAYAAMSGNRMKTKSMKLFAKVFGERRGTQVYRGELFGENWDTCLAIRLSGKIVLPHEIEGSWARPFSPFRTPDIMQG